MADIFISYKDFGRRSSAAPASAPLSKNTEGYADGASLERLSFLLLLQRGRRTAHIDKAGNTAKYWLQPVALARKIGYSAKELREIEAKVAQEATTFLEAWRVHFG